MRALSEYLPIVNSGGGSMFKTRKHFPDFGRRR